jgi:hypothetical protein
LAGGDISDGYTMDLECKDSMEGWYICVRGGGHGMRVYHWQEFDSLVMVKTIFTQGAVETTGTIP